jgi:hypothetical protein
VTPFIIDKTSSTKILMVDNIPSSSKETLQQCKICGASALHSHFGAMTCFPCKMFFKRNAETRQVSGN